MEQPEWTTGIGETGSAGTSCRGYDLIELGTKASYEDVAYLLLHGRLPNQRELGGFCAMVKAHRSLSSPLRRVLEQLPPETAPLDVLRTGCSALGCLEPESVDRPALAVAARLIGALPSMLLYWHAFTTSIMRIDPSGGDESVAGQLLLLALDRAPAPSARRALDVALTLSIEPACDGVASAARLAAVGGADVYGMVAAAMAAARGAPVRAAAAAPALTAVEAFLAVGTMPSGLAREDLASGLLAASGLPSALAAELRPIACVAAWIAHGMEQRGMPPAVRAVAYTGPVVRPVPYLDQR